MTAIDGFVRALDHSLAGPARLKADLLTEARHGLVDAAAAYRRDGVPAADAEDRAVREFGRLPELAPAFQAELAVAAAQRLALWLALIPLALASGSDLMWRGAPWVDRPPPSGYVLLAIGVDRISSLLTVGGFVAYAWLAWSARRGRPVPAATVRRVALAALAGVVTLAGAGAAVYVATIALAPAALTWPPMLIGAVVTMSALGWLAVRTVRCVAWSTKPAQPPASDGCPGRWRWP